MRISLSPVALFLYVWGLQIVSFSIGVSKILQPLQDLSVLQLSIFPISLIAFTSGALFVRVIPRKNSATKARMVSRVLSENNGLFFIKHKVRKYIGLLFIIVFVVALYNFFKFGYPPLINLVFNTPTEYTYMTYGSLKNVIFAACMLIPLVALYDNSAKYKYSIIFVSFGILILYAARGPIVQSTLQIMIFYAIKHNGKAPLKGIFYLILSALFIIFIMGLIGSLRTGTNAMYSALLIRPEFYNWPPGAVWVLAYISMPLQNLLSLLASSFNNFKMGYTTLFTLIPGFIHPFIFSHSEAEIWPNIIKNYFPDAHNTVATYLGAIYVDFGWPGMIFYNFLLGMFGSIIYSYTKLRGDNFICALYAIWASSIILIPFFNMFVLPSFLLEFLFLLVIYRGVRRKLALSLNNHIHSLQIINCE